MKKPKKIGKRSLILIQKGFVVKTVSMVGKVLIKTCGMEK